MKKLLFITIIKFSAILSYGQSEFHEMYYNLNFDNSLKNSHLIIPNKLSNKWQVGSPNKTRFKNAFSGSNAIVTDLTKPYPTNDTSVFIVKNVAGYGFKYSHTVALRGYYFVNSDTLLDFGKIEFSPNNGKTWIDLLDKESYYRPSSGPLPVLTGNSNAWNFFRFDILSLKILPSVNDTILYKFSFISDNIQTNKDGLMFDDLLFEDYVESIPEIQSDNLISVYPNPTSDVIVVNELKTASKPMLEISDLMGNLIYTDKNFIGGELSTKSFPNGIYVLKYTDSNLSTTKRIIVNH